MELPADRDLHMTYRIHAGTTTIQVSEPIGKKAVEVSVTNWEGKGYGIRLSKSQWRLLCSLRDKIRFEEAPEPDPDAKSPELAEP